MRLLPVLVPPHTAATSSGSRAACGRSLPNSWPCHAVSLGSGKPSEDASGRRESIKSHSCSTLLAHAANAVNSAKAAVVCKGCRLMGSETSDRNAELTSSFQGDKTSFCLQPSPLERGSLPADDRRATLTRSLRRCCSTERQVCLLAIGSANPPTIRL